MVSGDDSQGGERGGLVPSPRLCALGLIAGSVSYQPDPLDSPAPGNLLICCSQPRGDLVIDL
jgi:hypothetical protein